MQNRAYRWTSATARTLRGDHYKPEACARDPYDRTRWKQRLGKPVHEMQRIPHSHSSCRPADLGRIRRRLCAHSHMYVKILRLLFGEIKDHTLITRQRRYSTQGFR